MEKIIKLFVSPFHPPVEVVCDLIIQPFVPYSAEGVTLLINPNTTDYIENADQKDVKVRQSMFNEHTEHTKKIFFDFKANNSKIVDNEGRKVEIKLLKIGTEKIQDEGDFMFFEFYVGDVS